MAGFEVDPEALRRAATEVRGAADDLDSAVGAFAGSLSQVGDPWGLDMLGTLIGGGYVAIEQLALETLESIIAGFDSYADGLETMAGTYEAAEDENVSQVERLNRQV